MLAVSTPSPSQTAGLGSTPAGDSEDEKDAVYHVGGDYRPRPRRLLGLGGPYQPSASPNASLDAGGSPGAVYAMTNDVTNNQVVVLNRGADGRLTPAGSFPTGGQESERLKTPRTASSSANSHRTT